MIIDLFQLSSWNSIYYGNNLPIKNILQAISFHDPDVIAFSITAEENINSLIETINTIRDIYDQYELKIITGGYAARSLTERIKNLDVKVITEDISQIIKITEDLIES